MGGKGTFGSELEKWDEQGVMKVYVKMRLDEIRRIISNNIFYSHDLDCGFVWIKNSA